MKLYWVSAIIFNEGDRKPWLCAMTNGSVSMEAAMDTINRLKNNHNVLSAWIDTFENNEKQTVFHECYIDAFGYVTKR